MYKGHNMINRLEKLKIKVNKNYENLLDKLLRILQKLIMKLTDKISTTHEKNLRYSRQLVQKVVKRVDETVLKTEDSTAKTLQHLKSEITRVRIESELEINNIRTEATKLINELQG